MKDLNELEKLSGKILLVGKHTYIANEGHAYVAKKGEENALQIFSIKTGKLGEDSVHHVSTPTAEQYTNALLNYILDDNSTNESKKGIYNLGVGDIYMEFLDTVADLKFGRTSKERIITKFGLNKNDKVLAKLTNKVFESFNKTEDVAK